MTMTATTAPKDSRLSDSIDDLSSAKDLCDLITECQYSAAATAALCAANKIEAALARLNALHLGKAAA